MNICCVVVTYNRKELLLECIEALINQTYRLQEIIIIDNCSSDGTKEYLEENNIFNMDNVTYRRLNSNIGGAGGFYEGIKQSLEKTYDWIWIMDDDTVPTSAALENLISGREKIEEDKISFLCSKVIGIHNEEMNLPCISNRIGANGTGIWMKYIREGILEVEEATFVSILINANAIRYVGLPWKQFFIWGDDTEYTMRLNRFYGPGYVIGNSIVIHKRLSGNELSIIEEENIERVNLYKYRFRNGIIIKLNYKNKKCVIKQLINNFIYALRVLIKSNKYKFKKFKIVILSTLNGLFNKNLKHEFKDRMNT